MIEQKMVPYWSLAFSDSKVDLPFPVLEMGFRKTNFLEFGSQELWSARTHTVGCLETGGEEPLTSQVGFRIGYTILKRGTYQIILRLSVQSCQKQFICPKEFLDSFFLLAFLCLVTKNLQKNVHVRSSWASPSLSQPLRKSRTSTYWVKPHFKILRRCEICYTRSV